MRKFKIVDYSDVPAYQIKQEEIAVKYFSKLKRLDAELRGIIREYFVYPPVGNGGPMIMIPGYVKEEGKDEIKEVVKNIRSFASSIRPEIDELIRIHPDRSIFQGGDDVKLAYIFLTQGSLPVDDTFKDGTNVMNI